MSLTRFQKRNQLRLDPPVPDTEKARAHTEAHHKQFGKTVVWNNGQEIKVTDKVAGQEITTKIITPEETKELPEDVVIDGIEGSDGPDGAEGMQVPEDLKCPHCGSTARTESSYIKNHGTNCYRYSA